MDDLDTLSETLDAIANDVSLVSNKQAEQLDEIKQLQAQAAAGQPVDLAGVLAKAENIKAVLDNIAGAASSATASTSGSTDSGTTASDTGTGTTATTDTGTDTTGTEAPADPGAATSTQAA